MSDARRTANVYIDGFNLYYGCFDNSNRADWRRFRWLNLRRFCENAYPSLDIRRIRYFTAQVKPQPELNNEDCLTRQLVYLRALRTVDDLVIHEGRFATRTKKRLVADRTAKKPTPVIPLQYEYVIQEEEKGSDVNLATYILYDAFSADADLSIVVSNDSDLAEPIRLVRQRFGTDVYVLNPRNKHAADIEGVATRMDRVRRWMLEQAQFPDSFDDAQGTITKPERWS